MDLLIQEVLKILPAGQVLALFMLIFLMRVLTQVRDELRNLNGSVRELKVWSREHEKLDDERWQGIVERLNHRET